LQSAEPADRAWAAVGLSNLLQDPSTLQILLENGLTERLIAALYDEAIDVVLEVCGAIRYNIVFHSENV